MYTTAGREEKRQYLRDLGVKYITSSRNGDLVGMLWRGDAGHLRERMQGALHFWTPT